MNGRRTRLAVLALYAMLCAATAGASQGLQTKFAQVRVSNLRIGGKYSMADLVNFPLRVVNDGTETLKVKVTVMPPGHPNSQGMEPIPDVKWIELQRTTFTVRPGLEAVTDVVINIPNDEKLMGRQFYVLLVTESDNPTSLGVGIVSQLSIGISSEKPTAEQLKAKFVQKQLANLNFSFDPMETEINNMPLGRRVRLKDFHADLKLLNPNDYALDFRVIPVAFWESAIAMPPGMIAAWDPKWIIVSKEHIKAKGESFTPLDLSVKIPDDPRLRGKTIVLIVRAEILQQEIPAYAYGEIVVRTEK